ncbi:hypothetical protein [Roseomonas fluvialis]|uniref:Uncharacterized protein n=1 Tax=Roseomonas fluvialis TaxID=1750527 RepID=A0ABN6P868_9PROT|nr:hypothetical protein [Roseomonas fluvialis]BDG74082.1 hypothetical protein Rmf_40110 [Roseomonas fluvialis]
MSAAIRDLDTINRIIRPQEAGGFEFRNALYRAHLAGDVGALIEVLPRGRVPRQALWSAVTTIAVIGDDAGLSSGPGDFPDAGRLLTWAQRVMIHAAGGTTCHYDWAVAAARIHRRVLLVETNTAAEPAWMHLAERERDRREAEGREPFALLLIQVPADKPPHPAIMARAEGGAA